MATVSFTIDQTDAPFLQALLAQAQNAGKTILQMFDESKANGQPLRLSINGEHVLVLDEGSYGRPRGDAKQKEREKLRQLLMDGINSEAGEPMTQTDWDELKAEVKRRAEKRAGSAQ